MEGRLHARGSGVVREGARRLATERQGERPPGRRTGERHLLHGVGLVAGARDQGRIGTRRGRTWAGIARAAVGADVDRVGQPIGGIAVIGDIRDPRVGMRARIAKGAAHSLVVETILGRDQESVAIIVVGGLRLRQDVVIAADGGCVAPGAILIGIGFVNGRRSASAVVGDLRHHAAGFGNFENAKGH